MLSVDSQKDADRARRIPSTRRRGRRASGQRRRPPSAPAATQRQRPAQNEHATTTADHRQPSQSAAAAKSDANVALITRAEIDNLSREIDSPQHPAAAKGII